MDEDKIRKIKASLDEVHDWPGIYVFKFIMPTESDKKEILLSHFSDEVEVSIKSSRNDRFISITIKEVMFSSDDVLERYIQAHKIEGIIAL